MGNRTSTSSLSQDASAPPSLIKSFSSYFASETFVYGFAIDSTNRLLLTNWSTHPRCNFYDLETLEQVGSYDSNERIIYSCLFLSDTVCAISSSNHQLEIFSFKREDPPNEKKKKESIKISDCTLIKLLPLNDQSAAGNSSNHTILSLNSVRMNNNNNNSAQLVLASHRESCLSFWKTPNKNQLDDGNQYHQVRFLDLKQTYDFSAKYCRAKFLTSSSSPFCSSNSENSAYFVCTYLSGFCLFKVSWSENEQKQEVNIELLREIKLSDSVDRFGFGHIDVARHFIVAHAARDSIGYLYDLSNFRVVSELKATSTDDESDYYNCSTIKISEDADVVVLGTSSGNVHFFSQENNWKEVLFQQDKPAIEFGDMVLDLHLCSERQLLITGGKPGGVGVKSTPMKMYHFPILRNRWKRRRIVFLLQYCCGLRKTKQMLDLYRVRGCLALFL